MPLYGSLKKHRSGEVVFNLEMIDGIANGKRAIIDNVM